MQRVWACLPRPSPRLAWGTTIVQALAKQLGAIVSVADASPGTRVSVIHAYIPVLAGQAALTADHANLIFADLNVPFGSQRSLAPRSAHTSALRKAVSVQIAGWTIIVRGTSARQRR